MAESRRKRRENKERRLQNRKKKRRLESEAGNRSGYLGEGVSAGLNQQDSNLEELQRGNLPHCNPLRMSLRQWRSVSGAAVSRLQSQDIHHHALSTLRHL
ncbi:MAG: hypothetical protein R3C11_12750 [Planctomycetaceae bacterium]